MTAEHLEPHHAAARLLTDEEAAALVDRQERLLAKMRERNREAIAEAAARDGSASTSDGPSDPPVRVRSGRTGRRRPIPCTEIHNS